MNNPDWEVIKRTYEDADGEQAVIHEYVWIGEPITLQRDTRRHLDGLIVDLLPRERVTIPKDLYDDLERTTPPISRYTDVDTEMEGYENLIYKLRVICREQ